MTSPNSLPLLPPLGCAIYIFFWFLFFSFFCFLFSGSLLVFLQWLNATKIQKTKKNKKPKKQDPTLYHYSPPWGVQSFFFGFCFFLNLVFWFLVFWFVVGFLKGWQNNTKVKDLDLALCQFSHFKGCKLAFGWFYCLLWACGSIRKPCNYTSLAKCRYHWRKLGGLGTQIRQFCLFIYVIFQKLCWTNAKT